MNKKINLLKYALCLIFFVNTLIFFAYANGKTGGDIFFADMGGLSDVGNESAKKYVALTFDDGPHPVYTNKILDILEEKNVKATFFVVGFRAELHESKIKRILELGCEIGNHTYNHTDLNKAGAEQVMEELERCGEVIRSITGENPTLYRPPFGKVRDETDIGIPYTKVLWDVDSLDWNCQNCGKIVSNILSGTKDNSIILLHDFYASTVQALPIIIDNLREKGYEFATVSELFGRFDSQPVN